MLNRTIGSLVCVLCFLITPAQAQLEPSCIAPQWQWGQTGHVFHYYSEYIFIDPSTYNQLCYMSYWDNYDSTVDNLPFCYCDGGNDCPACSQQKMLAVDEKSATGSTRPAPVPDERLRLFGAETINVDGYGRTLLAADVTIYHPSTADRLDPGRTTEILDESKTKVGKGTAEILNERICSTRLDGVDVYFKVFEVRLTVSSTNPAKLKSYSTVVRTGVQVDGSTTSSSDVHAVDPSLFEVLRMDRISGAKSKCALFKLSPTRTYVVRLASS